MKQTGLSYPGNSDQWSVIGRLLGKRWNLETSMHHGDNGRGRSQSSDYRLLITEFPRMGIDNESDQVS